MKRLYELLKQKGFDVFFVGQQIGLGNSSYVVLSEGATRGQGSPYVGSTAIEVICVGKSDSYIAFEDFREKVKACLKEAKFLRYSGVETGIFADNTSESYICKIEYLMMKKLGG